MSRPRHFEKPEKWTDFYRTTDYAAVAYGIAKIYCKAHPDADRNIVFASASDAAFEYDVSDKLKRYKFKTFISVKIRTALYTAERTEKMITPEERKAMIAAYESGLTSGQIAIKFGRNASTVSSNLTNWKKQGLINEKTETVPEEAAIVPEKEVALPDPAETVRKLEEAGVEPVECDGTKIYAMKGVDFPVELCESHRPELWDDIACEIADFAAGILGAGTLPISRSSNEEMQYASVKLRTPDGKKVKIKMEVV
jgi:transposase-like protein